MKLFKDYLLGKITLKNRIVMAPMTRSRAEENIPNDLMATYYGQRATAGLIITEGTSPSPNGLGYPRIPGIFSEGQTVGWKKITDAVHDKGGKIFLQLMHTGRVSHPLNMDKDAKVLAPSAITLSGEMYTDQKGMQPYPEPEVMTLEDIEQARQEYVIAAKNAIKAGFDGVELHGANGYLMDQFFNPCTNRRTDDYGGSVENRNRFLVEVAQSVTDAIGKEKVGIRLSPYGAFNDMTVFDQIDFAYESLAKALGEVGLTYIHIVDHQAMGAPEVPESIKVKIQQAFGGDIIRSGGFESAEQAEKVLESGQGQLVAFGRPFIANPDLVEKLQNGEALKAPDFDTFYTPGSKGYTDY
ncbi:alkene reductase [Persicobacter diffluens]|uniref:Alkene reductase n=1 Tax=Persicobacter diffluens TaxID=981 RepID=A0AAN5AKI7_9BACT|nr:alkene reductase [Persicobacter diffluens]